MERPVGQDLASDIQHPDYTVRKAARHRLYAFCTDATDTATTALVAPRQRFRGFVRAVHLRPIIVTGDGLQVRLGLRWEINVPRDNLATIDYGRVQALARRVERIGLALEDVKEFEPIMRTNR